MEKIKKTKNFSKGFTLIELIVVIAIISIMFLVGYFSLNSPKTENRIKAAEREVASTIKAAHSYALQGKTNGSGVPRYWGFKFTSNKAYQLFYSNNADPTNTAGDTLPPAGQTEEYSLNNGVQLQSFTVPQDFRVVFGVPHGKATLPGGVSSFTFTLQLEGTTKTITVSSDGVVQESW